VRRELLPFYGEDCPISVIYGQNWRDATVVQGTLAKIEDRTIAMAEGINARLGRMSLVDVSWLRTNRACGSRALDLGTTNTVPTLVTGNLQGRRGIGRL